MLPKVGPVLLDDMQTLPSSFQKWPKPFSPKQFPPKYSHNLYTLEGRGLCISLNRKEKPKKCSRCQSEWSWFMISIFFTCIIFRLGLTMKKCIVCILIEYHILWIMLIWIRVCIDWFMYWFKVDGIYFSMLNMNDRSFIFFITSWFL